MISRLRSAATRDVWPLALGLGALALLATLTNAPGTYVADNRFDQYWAPGHRLLRQAFIWDGTRDLGRVREDFWPGSTGVIALYRGFGASPALAQHLWHSTLLAVGGIGIVHVVRLFRRPVTAVHVLAALFYMFSPYSATFLVPSSLYLPYALAPWLLVAFVRGVRGESPVRWAAVFALVLFAAGTDDPPGLAYALVPLAVAALYVVHVERSCRWRDVLLWSAGAGVLSLATTAAAIVKVTTGAGAFAKRLAETESPATLSVASSWSETWRGLGLWLAYFRDGPRLLRPQGSAYFTSAPLVLLTFVPGCVALAALWRSRWRPRLLFAALMLVSVVLMVGAYPLASPTPYGRALLRVYREVSWAGGLRNTYKAGAGFAIGTAVLLAVAASDVPGRVRRRLPYPWLAPAAVTVVIAVISYPFWTGRLYSPATRMDNPVPEYWHEAMRYLDVNDDGTRVLVLPGSTNTRYRWGWVGDDIFHALLRRPHAVPSGVPLSNPEAANVLQALAETVGTDAYAAGTIGPIARRLGIGVVVIRNDIDWQAMRLPRPVAYDSLRVDPDLTRVATFGEPGQNTVAARDLALAVFAEKDLPPVEIYAVKDAIAPERVDAGGAPLLVSGDGYAWPGLARSGAMTSGRPIAYTGDLGAEELAAAVGAGTRVVVSDTNRRRLTLLTGPRILHSHLLGPGEELDRPTPNLFTDPATQSVAWYPDASRIRTSHPTALGGFQPWDRAALAFDGDRRTAWRAGAFDRSPAGAWVRVDLRRPTRVQAMTLTTPDLEPGGRRATAFRVAFSDGSSVRVGIRGGRGTARFRPRTTTSIQIYVAAVAGRGLGPVGLSDVSIPGLDLAERVQLPDDLFRASRENPELARGLERAAMTFQFERVTGSGPRVEEEALRRRFRTFGVRSYTAAGSLRLGPDTSDAAVDALIGGAVGAYGTSRAGGALANRGGLAVDGRIDTGWTAEARAGEVLTVRFPDRRVDHVDVVTPESEAYSGITEVRVTVAGQSALVPLVPTQECASPGAGICARRGVLNLLPVRADRLTVEPTQIASRSTSAGPAPMQITEVYSDYSGNPAPLPADARLEGCRFGGVSVDGRAHTVAIDATYGDVLAGRAVPVRSCAPLELGRGWHEVESTGGVLLDALRLDTGDEVGPPRASVPAPRVTHVSPTHVRVRYRAGTPTVVTNGQSFDERWRARANGRDLGAPVSRDTLSAWAVAATGDVQVDMRFVPGRRFTAALATTLPAVLLCAALVVHGGRRRRG